MEFIIFYSRDERMKWGESSGNRKAKPTSQHQEWEISEVQWSEVKGSQRKGIVWHFNKIKFSLVYHLMFLSRNRNLSGLISSNVFLLNRFHSIPFRSALPHCSMQNVMYGKFALLILHLSFHISNGRNITISDTVIIGIIQSDRNDFHLSASAMLSQSFPIPPSTIHPSVLIELYPHLNE